MYRCPRCFRGDGIESVIELHLNEEEQQAFNHSVHQVYQTLAYIK